MNFDRQKKIAENRERALQRIRERQRNIRNAGRPAPTPAPKAVATAPERPPLTAVQRAIIERNRQKAIERQRVRQGVTAGSLRDAGTTQRGGVRIVQPQVPNGTAKPPQKPLRAFIHKSDYIEYDFSTMKDTFGGFLSEDRGDGVGGSSGVEKTFEDWKREKEQKELLHNPLQEAPPPLDIANAPTCFECKSIDIDKKLFQVFKCRVCKSCEEKHPEKYALLTKTECKEDYFLTDPELADTDLFRRIVKENPHSGTFSRMQLFLRYQIEEFAFKKWGGEENLDKEWLKRETMRKERREKKFNNKLKQMRRKLRAEELTSKRHGGKIDRHQHDWTAPVKSGDEPNVYKKRCIECGMEVEEIIF